MTHASMPSATEGAAERDEKETGRLEAFSDGVFAIAITLLVLELHVPPPSQSATLGRALANEWPAFAGFLTSFTTIGIMWINHHRLFTCVRRVDHGLLLANLLLLLGVTIVPFPTALVAEHLGHAGERTAALWYAGTFCFVALGFQVLMHWIISPHHRQPLLRYSPDHPLIVEIKSRYRYGPVAYGLALGMAAWHPTASVALQLAMALFFALPSKVRER